DAEIALRQGGTFGQTRNTGLVPLLHIFGEEDLPGPWALSFDLDAAAAPQGRAIDAAARIHYTVQPGSDLFLSLRILDGGADNDEVYSFATVTSVALGWRVRF
ncbi:MAG: hypothetical protein MH204_08420, partial [Fimbriimonadaceae bacterium]|nr:hypothetical protein [Fimbriimonadaceae bacterium]